MTANHFQNFHCWQDHRIGAVINKEAISVDQADFMATHTPLNEIRYLKSPYKISSTSESGLLDELLQVGQANHHAFVVVQGIPGTGKSHLIRWLDVRYRLEHGGDDVVLLIERAQNSLLGTLNQLITKIDFDDETLRQQLAKLKGATEHLSDRALADNVLNHLQVATYEHPLLDTERPRLRIRNTIERFLLDPVIREELKRPNGPIERITRFLTTGRRTIKDDSDRPEFKAEDFDFRTDILRAVRDQGYKEARELADGLNQKPALRDELAIYLNRLLDYAISRTTALSANDLRQMFNDIRHRLRREGKNLVLFIEDITAFTGIDSGLIDVLATQHTGESNRDFCRLISVVGITDSYFNDRFPDNMRDRVTHHLTLNAEQQRSGESQLLCNRSITADMAARYLNAMRVDHAELRMWLNNGSQIAHLPNPCNACPHRQPCHSAFGAVNIASGEDAEVAVGLYPFNKQSIWTMYQQIDTTRTSRTPRSLLNSVLLYVLQSHGEKIAEGTFPPPARELGNDFAPPSLARPIQQRIIDSQGEQDAKRIEALVLFWGDRTVDSHGSGELQTVGGLKKTVYHAFNVRFIAGEPVADDTTNVPVQLEPAATLSGKPPTVELEGSVPKTASAFPNTPGAVATEPVAPPSVTRSVETIPPQKTPYDDAISRWYAGERLDQYEDLRRFLATFIETSIDWEAYNVAKFLVVERLGARRLQIEGQAGQTKGDVLLFERTSDLRYVLQALAEMNHFGKDLNRESIGSHLATLAAWLRREEPRIVEYAQRPVSTVHEPMSLIELLLINCLLIEWSSDNLKATSDSPRDLLTIVLTGSVREISDKPLTEAEWAAKIERARGVHSKPWIDILRSIGNKRVKTCHISLLRLLNRAQGNSQEVRFIDAATALDIITAFKQRDWSLQTVSAVEDSSAPLAWQDGTRVYELYAHRLEDIMTAERNWIGEQVRHLNILLGENTPDEAHKAIQATLISFQEHQQSYTLGASPVGSRMLVTAREFLSSTLAVQERTTCAIRLSAGTRYIEQIQSATHYFEEFVKLVQRINDQLLRKKDQLSTANSGTQLYQQVEQHYAALADGLRSLTTVSVEENQP